MARIRRRKGDDEVSLMRSYGKEMTEADRTIVAGRRGQTPGRIDLRVRIPDTCPVLLMLRDIVVTEHKRDIRLLTIEHQGQEDVHQQPDRDRHSGFPDDRVYRTEIND